MPDKYPGFVCVVDAMRERGISRESLKRLTKEGKLQEWSFPRDKRLYYKREELEQALQPQPRSPASAETERGVNAE